MHFAQIYTPGIAQSSYVIGTGGKCVIVDPVRNIEPYLEKAKEFGMEIAGVLETHLHADFISGHMELADATGAEIYAPKVANCTFPHRALENGEEFTIDDLKFKLIETPGHTPDCSVYVVTNLKRSEDPVLVFTGDTLMVGEVGRPDLFPDREEELAEKLYYSLKCLKELEDHVELYPAHGLGSLCGKALSAKLWSTMGTEKRFNYAMQHKNLDDFKEELLKDMPTAPDHFSRCSEINRTGPGLKKEMGKIVPLKAADAYKAYQDGFTFLDVRPYHSFASAHIPNSYSISKDGSLATFAGWVIPPEDKLILVLGEADMEKIKRELHNVGLDNIYGYLEGSVEKWLSAGFPVNNVGTLSVQSLFERIKEKSPLVIDNRAKNEWDEEHVEATTLAPTPDIRHRYKEWDPEEEIVVLCNTSNRSMTAASLLKQRGFKKVINVMGGTTAWSAAGLPMVTEGDEK